MLPAPKLDAAVLRAFVAVARLGGVGRAADALSLTQPSVSARIATLDGAAGLPVASPHLTTVRSGSALGVDRLRLSGVSPVVLATAVRAGGRLPAGAQRFLEILAKEAAGAVGRTA